MLRNIVTFEIEMVQLASIVFILLIVSMYHPVAIQRFTRAMRRIGRHRAKCAVFVGVLGFAASAALTAVSGTSVPIVHDEFSYLLAADTFTHGRLTNPSPPSPVHFEALHINVQPTYHSMYPPAQGGALAIGKLIGGHPIVGVWLSMGLACAATCWMLQAWVPPHWALVGGLMSVFRFVFMRHPGTWLLQIGYWSQNYWGGAVAMLGAALVFGAMRRIARSPRPGQGVLLGIGLAIVANSRPFEGFVMGLLVGIETLSAIVCHARREPVRTLRTALAVAGVLIMTLLWMSYYNYRTTGSPMKRPYELNARTYGTTPLTLLQNVQPEPAFRHGHIRSYYSGWAKSKFLRQQELRGYLDRLKEKGFNFWLFYFGPLLSIPFVALPWALRNIWVQFALMVCALVLLALTIMPWFQIHYLAPLAPMFIFLEVSCLRVLRLSRFSGKSFWRLLAIAIPLTLIIVMPVHAINWSQAKHPRQWNLVRQRLLTTLTSQSGKHLVFVRYPSFHNTNDEWVYNEADIDKARVVWAHDMGPTQNKKLLERFQEQNRQVWLLHVRGEVTTMEPYPLDSRPSEQLSNK